MRASVDVVPIRFGLGRYHGAARERLTVALFTGLGSIHVPVPRLPAGSAPNGHPAPPWLHTISISRLWSAVVVVGDVNDCMFAARVVSLTCLALARARMIWLVMKRPCSATSP